MWIRDVLPMDAEEESYAYPKNRPPDHGCLVAYKHMSVRTDLSGLDHQREVARDRFPTGMDSEVRTVWTGATTTDLRRCLVLWAIDV